MAFYRVAEGLRGGNVQSTADYGTANVFAYDYQVPQGNPHDAGQSSYATGSGFGLGACFVYDSAPPKEIDLGSTHYKRQTRRYDCHICADSTGFGRLQDLKRHIGHKHDVEPVVCSVPGCEEKFPKARPDYMRRHIDRDHLSRIVKQG